MMTTTVSHDVSADRSCDLTHDVVDEVEVLTFCRFVANLLQQMKRIKKAVKKTSSA